MCQWIGIRECKSEDKSSGNSLVPALVGSIKNVCNLYFKIVYTSWDAASSLLEGNEDSGSWQHRGEEMSIKVKTAAQDNSAREKYQLLFPSHASLLLPKTAENIRRNNGFFTVLHGIRSRVGVYNLNIKWLPEDLQAPRQRTPVTVLLSVVGYGSLEGEQFSI